MIKGSEIPNLPVFHKNEEFIAAVEALMVRICCIVVNSTEAQFRDALMYDHISRIEEILKKNANKKKAQNKVKALTIRRLSAYCSKFSSVTQSIRLIYMSCAK
jgi:hypothetical protein